MLLWGLWSLIIFSATRIHLTHTSIHNHTPHRPHWQINLSVSLNQLLNYSTVRQSKPDCKTIPLSNWLANKPQTTKLQHALKWVLSSRGEASGVKVSFTDHYKSKTCRSKRFTCIAKSAHAKFSTPKFSDWKAAIVDWRITSGQKERFNSSWT